MKSDHLHQPLFAFFAEEEVVIERLIGALRVVTRREELPARNVHVCSVAT